MWNQILDLAINNGLWAVLFMGLLIYQLKDSKNREKKYQDTIAELSNTLTKVNKIDDTVSVLAENIVEVKENLSKIEDSVSVLVNTDKGESNEQNKNNRILD